MLTIVKVILIIIVALPLLLLLLSFLPNRGVTNGKWLANKMEEIYAETGDVEEAIRKACDEDDKRRGIK